MTFMNTGWKWLVLGLAIGASIVTLYAYSATAEARAKLEVLDKRLEQQEEISKLATERADAAEATARELDVVLVRVREEEGERQQVLLQRIAARNATIAGLRREEQEAKDALIALRASIATATSSEVATAVQRLMIDEYAEFPGSLFEFRTDFFWVNDPGGKAVLAGFSDAISRKDQLGILVQQRDQFEGKVGELQGMATSLNTILLATEDSREEWKVAWEKKDVENVTLVDRLKTQDEMIAVLKEKNFWEKIPAPARVGIIFASGILIGREIK